MGFDRVYPPGASPEQAIIDLRNDLWLREEDIHGRSKEQMPNH